jgi:hypothetical protein
MAIGETSKTIDYPDICAMTVELTRRVSQCMTVTIPVDTMGVSQNRKCGANRIKVLASLLLKFAPSGLQGAQAPANSDNAFQRIGEPHQPAELL